VELSIYPINTN